MQTRSKSEQMLIKVGLPLALLVLVWGLWPSSSASPGGKRSAYSLADALQQTVKQRADYVRMKREQTETEPKIGKMAYDLPAEQLTPRIIRDLQAIASRAGVHLREIKPQRPRLLPGGYGARVPLEVRFRATFQPNVVDFLYQVEDPTGRLVVDKINISSADSRFKNVDVSAQISAFTSSSAGITGGEGGDISDAASSPSRG